MNHLKPGPLPGEIRLCDRVVSTKLDQGVRIDYDNSMIDYLRQNRDCYVIALAVSDLYVHLTRKLLARWTARYPASDLFRAPRQRGAYHVCCRRDEKMNFSGSSLTYE